MKKRYITRNKITSTKTKKRNFTKDHFEKKLYRLKPKGQYITGAKNIFKPISYIKMPITQRNMLKLKAS